MQTMEARGKNPAGSSPSISATNNVPTNQGHVLPGSVQTNQSQASQPLLSQTMQRNTASGMPDSNAISSFKLPVSSITTSNVTSLVNQNCNMLNVAGMVKGSSGQHGLSSNMFEGSQRQMIVRPHGVSSQQQQQPQSEQYLYQQKLQQQQVLKQNFHSDPNLNPLLPSHIRHQQQNVLQPNQLHSSQQSGSPTSATQPSTVNTAFLQGIHTNQQSSPQFSAQQTTQSTLRQHQSSILRSHPNSQEASSIHQQQTSLAQQSVSPLKQQQNQMMRQQVANSSGTQQKQMMEQLAGDNQQQLQRSLMNQTMNIQQQQSQQQQPQHPLAQQKFMSQQNSIQNQQSLGTQSKVTGLSQSQQKLVNSQGGNSSLQTNQHPVKMLTQPKVELQQTHLGGNSSLQTNQQPVQILIQPKIELQQTHMGGHGLFSSQVQQSQNQPSQQQKISQLQSHHQQLSLQQKHTLLQQDVQHTLQASDQQRQLYQSQRTLPEMRSPSLDATAQSKDEFEGDWQEEVFQKINSMKVMYFRHLCQYYQKVVAMVQQGPRPQQQSSDQFERLKLCKAAVERLIRFVSVSKSNITPELKGNVDNAEKQILSLLRGRKTEQQQQLLQSQMQPIQKPQSQTIQDQSHDSETNPQMQKSMQGSGPRAPQSSVTNIQNNALSSRPAVSSPQQNMTNSIPASSLESGKGKGLDNGQQVVMQQNAFQQVNNSSVSSQSGLNLLQSNCNQTQLQQQQDQQMSQQLRQQSQQLLSQQYAIHQPPQSQTLKVELHDTQTNPQMQPMSLQGYGPMAQQSSLANLQNNALSSRPRVSSPQQSMANSIPASSLQQQRDQKMPQQLRQKLQQRQLQQQVTQQQQQQLQTRHKAAELQQMNDKMQRKNVSDETFHKHSRQGQRDTYPLEQLKPGTQLPFSPPKSASPQITQQQLSPQMTKQQLSPQVQQKNLSSDNKMGSPLKPVNSPFVVPSLSSPMAPSPMQVVSEEPSTSSASMGNTARQQATDMQGVVQSTAIGTPEISASPLLQEPTTSDGNHLNPSASTYRQPSTTETPAERLCRLLKYTSAEALSSAANDIKSVVSMVDRLPGPVPRYGSRAPIGEDLAATTKCRRDQSRNNMTQEEMMPTKKMRLDITAMPFSPDSPIDTQFSFMETSNSDSPSTSYDKKARTETEHALMEEIKLINQRHVDTVVEICDDQDTSEGTKVKFSFLAVSVSSALKALISPTQNSPIQPLYLLVPHGYPEVSPFFLDNLSVETRYIQHQ